MLLFEQEQKDLEWQTHYLLHYKTTRRINNRKKDTPANRRVVWSTFCERFASLEEAIKVAKVETDGDYKIYRIEPTLIEESL